MTAIFKQKNPRWIEKLKLRLQQAGGKEVAVGYPKGKEGVGNAHYDSGASILQVAIWNNFGTESIPRRAFMELAATTMQPQFKEMLKKAIKRLNAGEIKIETVLKAAGHMGEAEVRKAIDDGGWDPNSPETMARKGSEVPLIDSGDMRKYATHIIRERS